MDKLKYLLNKNVKQLGNIQNVILRDTIFKDKNKKISPIYTAQLQREFSQCLKNIFLIQKRIRRQEISNNNSGDSQTP